MGFKFRKRIKIAPGVSLNLTQKGITSTSVGKAGATVNLGGKKGTSATVGLPGSGLSYSTTLGAKANGRRPVAEPAQPGEASDGKRRVSFWLGMGIFLMPYLFAWVLLIPGYSTRARILSFAWMGFFVVPFLLRH